MRKFPVLVGITEISVLFGVSRQRVSQLAAQDDFPMPVAKLACGPIYRKADIVQFQDYTWNRKLGKRCLACKLYPTGLMKEPCAKHAAEYEERERVAQEIFDLAEQTNPRQTLITSAMVFTHCDFSGACKIRCADRLGCLEKTHS